MIKIFHGLLQRSLFVPFVLSAVLCIEERLGMEKIYRRSERGRRSEAAELAAFLYDVYFAGHHHIDIYHRYKRQIFLMPTRKIHGNIIKIRYTIYRQRNISESRGLI